MKKTILPFLLLILTGALAFAQDGQVTSDTPSRDGYVQSLQTTFYETNLDLYTKNNPSSSRIAFVEFPVNEFVAATKVEFEIDYFYTNKGEQQTPVNFDIMEGGLIDTIQWDYQPDSANFTSIAALELFNNANYGVKSFDITDAYNAAIGNGAEYITVRVSVATQDTTDALLKFRSSEATTGSAPKLVIDSNCPRFRIDVDTMVCAGTTIQIGDVTVSGDGVYVDSLLTVCGADSVRTYYAWFIEDGTVTVDTSLCAGEIYSLKTGPRQTMDYTEAGNYTDVITNGVCTMTVETNLSYWDLPVPQDLGDDIVIKEAESVTLDAGAGFAAYQWSNDGKAIDGETAQTLEVTMTKEAFHLSVNEIMVTVTDENGCQGSDDIWVEIKGNRFEPQKDAYLESAQNKVVETTRLRVKYDLIGDPLDPASDTRWTRETMIAFDMTDAEVTEDMTNFRLRLYFDGFTDGYDVEEGTIVQFPVDCQYIDGLYDDAWTFADRPADGIRTVLAAPQIITRDILNTFVDWDINDVFVEDILGKKNLFTIILSSYGDPTSSLAQFRALGDADPEWWPTIVYDIDASTGISKELILDQVSVYPNPANDILHISGNVEFSHATLFDMTGKTVLSVQLNSQAVSLSTLEKGMYIIRLENDQMSANKIIVKQ